MGRRVHGEGTITQRKNGLWQAALSLGTNTEGQRRRRTVYGRTQKEVRQKLEELKKQIGIGDHSENKLVVGTYLQTWLEEKSKHVKANTAEKYAYTVCKHIIPRVGTVKLNKLTPILVQSMIANINDEVGTSSANRARTVLYMAYRQALKFGMVTRNPVEPVDPLKASKRQMKLWTSDEAMRFLDTAESHRLYALFYLAMSTGMRRGELLGLRWCDIRPNALYICQSLIIIEGKVVISTVKTASSERWVAISEDVIAVLTQHRKSMEKEFRRRNAPLMEADLVFPSEVGTPLNPDNLKRVRCCLMTRAKVPHIRLHDLRHFHASLAISSGMDPKTLADRLGHSKASFTIDRYTHLFDEQRAKSAISIVDYLNKAKKPE